MCRSCSSRQELSNEHSIGPCSRFSHLARPKKRSVGVGFGSTMTHPEVRRRSRSGGYLAVLNEGVVGLHLVELLTNRLDSTNRLGTSPLP